MQTKVKEFDSVFYLFSSKLYRNSIRYLNVNSILKDPVIHPPQILLQAY